MADTVVPVTLPATTIEIRPDAITDAVQSAYSFLDQWHLSPLMLTCLAVVIGVSLLLSLRELGAWFFKTNGLKRQIRELHDEMLLLQKEVKRLQQLSLEVAQARQDSIQVDSSNLAPPQPDSSAQRKTHFPISH